VIWDRILTIHNYYDGPRLGIAEVNGIPHIYESEFDEDADDYAKTYLVSAIDEVLLSLVLEDWEIWLRWDAAWKRGDVTLDTHPALPADRQRYETLKAEIGQRLTASPEASKRMTAEFRNLQGARVWTGVEVHWSESGPQHNLSQSSE
jgi:hypothetical protein